MSLEPGNTCRPCTLNQKWGNFVHSPEVLRPLERCNKQGVKFLRMEICPIRDSFQRVMAIQMLSYLQLPGRLQRFQRLLVPKEARVRALLGVERPRGAWVAGRPRPRPRPRRQRRGLQIRHPPATGDQRHRGIQGMNRALVPLICCVCENICGLCNCQLFIDLPPATVARGNLKALVQTNPSHYQSFIMFLG